MDFDIAKIDGIFFRDVESFTNTPQPFSFFFFFLFLFYMLCNVYIPASASNIIFAIMLVYIFLVVSF